MPRVAGNVHLSIVCQIGRPETSYARHENLMLLPGAPVIRIRSYSLLGGNNIWRLPPEAMSLPRKQAQKLAKAAERSKLPN